MRRLSAILLTCGLALAAAYSFAQPPDDQGPPPRPRDGGGQGGPGGPGGARGGFHLLPPFLMERLNLSDDQKQQVADLEKETKAKLEKILTPEQMKQLTTFRPMRPGQGRGQGQGQGRRGGGPGGGPDDNSDQGPPRRPQRPPAE